MKTKVLFSCILLFALLASCQSEPQAIKVTGITINSSSLSLIEGETAELTATISPKDADNKTVIWSSSNGSVASVSNGKVTALSPGSTSISVKSDDGGFTATCAVSVASKVIAVTSVSLSKTELTLVEGESETLIATISPDDATDKTVTWTSSNTGVATVNNGTVSAIMEGESTITAKVGDKTVSCKVIVKKKVIAVESVILNKTELNLIKGDTEVLVATVNPENASEKSVTWTSDAPSIVSIDQNGMVTALNGGEATITAKAGNTTATCVVKVTVPVVAITLNKQTLDLVKGQTENLIAVVMPEDATSKNVAWSSSDEAIVSIDQNGMVTALNGGEATITASIGDMKATCRVFVTVPVEGVSLNASSLALNVGNIVYLIATISPTDASDQTIVWSSSDPAIVEVYPTSMPGEAAVYAADIGSAVITASSGSHKAECNVVVVIPTPEAVDLGLSVKWASFNLGASRPEEFGGYFAWGEIKQKGRYEWSTYKWGSEPTSMTKYNAEDNKVYLDAEEENCDDAARSKLGGSWRMPTKEEMSELVNQDNCSWAWQQNYKGTGISGYLVTSKIKGYTENSIFLPAAGERFGMSAIYESTQGFYWTSSVDKSSTYYERAYALHINKNVGFYVSNINLRYYGHSIRPVTE